MIVSSLLLAGIGSVWAGDGSQQNQNQQNQNQQNLIPVVTPAPTEAPAPVASTTPAPVASVTPASPTPVSAITVQMNTSPTLGAYLTDSAGKSLYLFAADSMNMSTCSGACATVWPPLTVPSGQVAAAGTGVTGSLLSTITRADGTTQVTYNGLPLYYYSGDTSTGNTNGEGISSFGALWFLVTPAGASVTPAA